MDNFDLTKYLAEGKLKETFVKLSDEQKAKVIAAAKRGEAPEDVIDSDFNGDDKYLQSVKALMDKSKLNEADNKSVLRTLIQDLEPFEYEVYASDAGVDPEDGAEMEEYIASLSDEEVSSEISKLKGINEDKLDEAMLDVTTTEKIAQAVADAFTAEDNELDLRYTVTPGTSERSFDLDVERGPNTPDEDSLGQDIENYLGDYAGGSFYIKDGVVYNAAMRNAPVAKVTPEGGIEMISAEDSRAAIGMEENKEETKTNKMKKSELKEMIKMAMLEDARTDAEQEGYKDGFEDAKDDIEDKLKDMKVSEAENVEVEDDENVDVKDTENVDVDIEKDVKVDDEESEVDIDVKASMPGESEDVEEVQALLMKAQEAAEALDDEKLTDQIGNTITYFTRSHVARNVSEADLDMDLSVGDRAEEAEIGLEEAKKNLNESMFPMWNKIK